MWKRSLVYIQIFIGLTEFSFAQKEMKNLEIDYFELKERETFYKNRLNQYLFGSKGKKSKSKEAAKQIDTRDWIKAKKNFDQCWSMNVSGEFYSSTTKAWSMMQKCFKLVEGEGIIDKDFSHRLLEQKLRNERDMRFTPEIIEQQSIKSLQLEHDENEKIVLPGIGEILSWESDIQSILVKYVDDKSMQEILDKSDGRVVEEISRLMLVRQSLEGKLALDEKQFCENLNYLSDKDSSSDLLKSINISTDSLRRVVDLEQLVFAGEIKDLDKVYFKDDFGEFFVFRNYQKGQEVYVMAHKGKGKKLRVSKYVLSKRDPAGLERDQIRKKGPLVGQFGKQEIKGGIEFDYGIQVETDEVKTWKEQQITYPINLNIYNMKVFVPIKDLRWQVKNNLTLGSEDSQISSILYSKKNRLWQLENEIKLGVTGKWRVNNRLRVSNIVIGHSARKSGHSFMFGYYKDNNYILANWDKSKIQASAGRFFKSYPGGVEYSVTKERKKKGLFEPMHRLKLVILLNKKKN